LSEKNNLRLRPDFWTMLENADMLTRERMSARKPDMDRIEQWLTRQRSLADQRYGRLLSLVTQDVTSQDQSELWYISVFGVLGSVVDAQADALVQLMSKLQEVGVLKARLELAEKGLAERQKKLQQVMEAKDAAEKKREESRKENLRYVT
jgi:hypothetical protein